MTSSGAQGKRCVCRRSLNEDLIQPQNTGLQEIPNKEVASCA